MISSDSPDVASEIHIVSRLTQILLISVIMVVTVLANLLVISTIWSCHTKSRLVSYQLVTSLCMVDLLGACAVLPVPLAVTILGEWRLTTNMCFVNSFITILIWGQHMIMFALLKVDKLLVSVLAKEKYSLISVFWTRVVILVTWVLSAVLSFCVNSFYVVEYEPAVLLCIPSLPKEFFLVAMAILAFIFASIIIGFLGALVYLMKAQTRIQDVNSPNQRNYKALQKSLCSNFLLTMFHIV